MSPPHRRTSTGPAMGGGRGGEVWLRRLRFIGIAVPVLFLVALQLMRVTVFERFWPGQGILVAGVIGILAAAAFGIAMFYAIDRAYRLVIRQNRELAALDAVSTAIRAGSDIDQVVTGALDALLAATGAFEAGVTAASASDGLVGGQGETWHRMGSGAQPGETVEVPLLAARDVVGNLSVTLPAGTDRYRLSRGAMQSIGRHLGSAMQRLLMIEHLQRGRRESEAVHHVLLQISQQEPLTRILGSIAGFARQLLSADEAGLCLEQGLSGLVAVDESMAGCSASGGQVCIAVDDAVNGPLPLPECPLVNPHQYAVFVASPLNGPEGQSGRIWIGRRATVAVTPRDRGFLVTLAELAVVALSHARMLDNERQAAVLVERDRIAREMHDSLAQVLGVLHLRLRALSTSPELGQAAGACQELTELADLCQEAYRDVREAILGLRESARPDRTLLESLHTFVDKFARQSRIATTLDNLVERDLQLSPQSEVQVLRVIQEALTNVRKHSGASSARVRVSATPHQTTFVVEDDGRGFDPAAVDLDREGYGLHTMRERTESVQGRLTIESKPGGGTRVVVGLPRAQRFTSRRAVGRS